MQTPRYALYLAPRPTSGWGQFGARWLGRDAVSGEPLEQPAIAGLAREDQHALTASPRKYGFHATLKGPFASLSAARGRGGKLWTSRRATRCWGPDGT